MIGAPRARLRRLVCLVRSDDRHRAPRAAGRACAAIVSLCLLSFAGTVMAAADASGPPFRMSDEQCLGCHAGARPNYSRVPGTLRQESPWVQHPYIDVARIRAAAHGGLHCVDCHVEGFDVAPHRRAQEKVLDCMACHSPAGEAQFEGLAARDAPYHFERIEAEFHGTAHFAKHADKFLCSDCHHPHYFETTARFREPKAIVANENGWCVSCHSADPTGPPDIIDWAGLLDPARPDLVAVHGFLPRAARHLEATRCVDCHADPHAEFSHQLVVGTDAAACTTCHALDSVQAGLYRYADFRMHGGFTNDAVARDSYVMAATRSRALDVFAYVVAGLTLLGMGLYGARALVARFTSDRRNDGGPDDGR